MRTCAICGAELPERLRHGAKYCPHGRCKTKAYRQRKKDLVQTGGPEAPQPATRASREAQPSAPLIFTHAVACTCGQQLTIQILISQAQTGELPLSAPATPMRERPGASDVARTSPEPPDLQPPPPPAPMRAESTAPCEAMPSTAEVDASLAAPSVPEQTLPIPERRIDTPTESAIPDALPERALCSDAHMEGLVESALADPLPEAGHPPPDELTQSVPERSANQNNGLSEPGITRPAADGVPGAPVRASSPDQAATPSDDSFGKDFWRLARESPMDALAVFYRLLDLGHARMDPQLVERAYCGMALVYALRGDEARAVERLGHARVAATRRGNTSDLEAAEQHVTLLLSRKAQ